MTCSMLVLLSSFIFINQVFKALGIAVGLVKHKRNGRSKVNNLKYKVHYYWFLIGIMFFFFFFSFFLNKYEKLKWKIMGYSCTLWWKWWVEIVFYFSFQQCLSQVSPKLLIFFAIMINITNVKNWYFDFNITLISSKLKTILNNNN